MANVPIKLRGDCISFAFGNSVVIMLNDVSTRLTSWFLRKTANTAVRRIAAFSAALGSDIGIKRDENQDRVAIARGRDFAGKPFVLVALSDGIGGMRDGSACAAATLGHLFARFFEIGRSGSVTPEVRLVQAVEAANSAVFEKYAGKGGATLSTVLLSLNGNAHLINVGDSRVYRVSGGDLVQLTVDDTIAGQLGHKTDTEFGSNLLQFIGIGKPLEAKVMLSDGNQKEEILLTSDGIHYLDQRLLGGLIKNASDPGIALRRITELAKWLGGHDNATAALVTSNLVSYETASTDNYDVLDIWDPFGELQLVLPGIRHVQREQLQYVQDRPDFRTGGVALAAKSAVIEESTAKSPKMRRKRERKPRYTAQKNSDNRLKIGREKSKAPQLRIDFPKKG